MFKHPPRSVPSASETPTMFKHPPASAPTALASTSEPRSTHPSISLAPSLRERNAPDVQTSSPFRPLRGRNSHDVQTSSPFRPPQRAKLPRCSNIRRVLHPPHWRRLPNRGPPTPPSPSRPRSANETPTMFKHPPRSVPYASETPPMFKHPPRSAPLPRGTRHLPFSCQSPA